MATNEKPNLTQNPIFLKKDEIEMRFTSQKPTVGLMLEPTEEIHTSPYCSALKASDDIFCLQGSTGMFDKYQQCLVCSVQKVPVKPLAGYFMAKKYVFSNSAGPCWNCQARKKEKYGFCRNCGKYGISESGKEAAAQNE